MTTSLHGAGIVPEFTLADRVRKAREYAGMSQTELATETGMARSGLARIEQGGTPRRSTMILISMATGVDLTWLETGKTPAGPETDGGSECAIRESNPEPTDLCAKLALAAPIAA